MGATLVVDAGKRASLYMVATRRQVVHPLQVSLSPPHQLARPDALQPDTGGGGSRPGDGGGGPAGAIAIRGARTRLPKVLAVSADEGPMTRLAGRPYQLHIRDATGHGAATTPLAATTPPPIMRKLESSAHAPPYSQRIGFVEGLVKKKKWLHTLGDWSNIEHNKDLLNNVHA
jgi:hypothetical protein